MLLDEELLDDELVGSFVDFGKMQFGVGDGVPVPGTADVGSGVGEDLGPAVAVGVGVQSGMPVSVMAGLAAAVAIRLGAAAGTVDVPMASGVVVPTGRALVPNAAGVPVLRVDGEDVPRADGLPVASADVAPVPGVVVPKMPVPVVDELDDELEEPEDRVGAPAGDWPFGLLDGAHAEANNASANIVVVKTNLFIGSNTPYLFQTRAQNEYASRLDKQNRRTIEQAAGSANRQPQSRSTMFRWELVSRNGYIVCSLPRSCS